MILTDVSSHYGCSKICQQTSLVASVVESLAVVIRSGLPRTKIGKVIEKKSGTPSHLYSGNPRKAAGDDFM